MKFILILLLLMIPAHADDFGHDYKKFFTLKYEVRENLRNVMKKNFKGEINQAVQLKISEQLDDQMRKLRNNIPFEYSIVSDILDGILFVSVIVEYNDEISSIIWENHVMSNPDTMQFFSRVGDSTPQSFDDYYSWDQLWRN